MLPLILLLNAPAQVIVNPRPVFLSIHVHHNTLWWRARNAYECYIEGLDNGYHSGDIPTMGRIDLPAGKYRITAVGDRHRTAIADFEVF